MLRAPSRRLAMLAAGFLAVGLLAAPTAASADTAPHGSTPATVSTDALPTVQINGVVWSQIIIGDTVYAAGRFSQARPAGAKKGTHQTRRSNMLAYDLTTGVLLTGFAPDFNSEVRSIAASSDGRTIYAVGNFTAVNGKRHTRIAAISSATGKNEPFSGSLNSLPYTVAVHDGTVYTGGQFTSASGKKRTRLAAFAASTGALRSWAPTANRAVQAVAVSSTGKSIVVAGHFSTVNGRTATGSARVSDGTGKSNLSWAVNKTVQNNGPDAAVYSLSSDGDYVYMSGYSYHPTTKQKRLEGVAAVTWNGGSVHWIEDCHGDTYSTAPVGDVIYTASHAHDCKTMGGFAQTKPVRYNHALAFSRAATQKLKHQTNSQYTDYQGRPAPSLLTWYPGFTNGSYTGLNQAAWSVTGTSRYVVYGGEFPTVNGIAQQGLVRFAVSASAPNVDGPRLSGSDYKPTLKALGAGTVRITFKADFDRDNEYLTNRIVRDGAIDAPVATITSRSRIYYDRPTYTYTESGLVPGTTYSYRLYASDPFGNTAVGASATVTVK